MTGIWVDVAQRERSGGNSSWSLSRSYTIQVRAVTKFTYREAQLSAHLSF